MNPPLFATALLFLGPILVLLGGRLAFLSLCVAGLIGGLAGAPSSFSSLILALIASYGLILLGGQKRRHSLGILLWSALCTLPLWAMGIRGIWRFWPGHGLSNEEWNPIAGGWFYETWGSGSLLPSPSYSSILLSYLGLSMLLRIGLHVSGTISHRATNPDSRDET